MKARIFWYFEFLKFRMMTSYFREMTKRPFLEDNQKRNTTTTIVARKTTTRNRKYDRVLAETALSCNDCVATIVTKPFTPTMKGGGVVNSAIRSGNKSVISPDSKIRRGLGTGTHIFLYKFLASLLCPELNLINISIHFLIMRS